MPPVSRFVPLRLRQLVKSKVITPAKKAITQLDKRRSPNPLLPSRMQVKQKLSRWKEKTKERSSVQSFHEIPIGNRLVTTSQLASRLMIPGIIRTLKRDPIFKNTQKPAWQTLRNILSVETRFIPEFTRPYFAKDESFLRRQMRSIEMVRLIKQVGLPSAKALLAKVAKISQSHNEYLIPSNKRSDAFANGSVTITHVNVLFENLLQKPAEIEHCFEQVENFRHETAKRLVHDPTLPAQERNAILRKITENQQKDEELFLSLIRAEK